MAEFMDESADAAATVATVCPLVGASKLIHCLAFKYRQVFVYLTATVISSLVGIAKVQHTLHIPFAGPDSVCNVTIRLPIAGKEEKDQINLAIVITIELRPVHRVCGCQAGIYHEIRQILVIAL